MTRVDSASVSRAIKKKHDIAGIILWNPGGYCRFASDHDGLDMALIDTESIYTCYMNQLTIERWVREFEWALEKEGITIEQLKEISNGTRS